MAMLKEQWQIQKQVHPEWTRNQDLIESVVKCIDWESAEFNSKSLRILSSTYRNSQTKTMIWNVQESHWQLGRMNSTFLWTIRSKRVWISESTPMISLFRILCSIFWCQPWKMDSWFEGVALNQNLKYDIAIVQHINLVLQAIKSWHLFKTVLDTWLQFGKSECIVMNQTDN